jgi:hypothetical protein
MCTSAGIFLAEYSGRNFKTASLARSPEAETFMSALSKTQGDQIERLLLATESPCLSETADIV